MLVSFYQATWHHVLDTCTLDTHNGEKIEFNLCEKYLQTALLSTELACYELVYSAESNFSSQVFMDNKTHCN